MAAFFGTVASCALLAVGSLFWRQDHFDSYLFIGGVIYLVGTVLVTVLFNASPAKRFPALPWRLLFLFPLFELLVVFADLSLKECYESIRSSSLSHRYQDVLVVVVERIGVGERQ